MRVWLADRLFGSALALLLQAGFLFALLQAVRLFSPTPQQAREMTLFLPPLSRPVPPRPAEGTSRPAPVIAVPRLAPPTAAPPATAPDASALRGLGQSLFGCAPEAYATQTPEERTHCPKPGVNAPLSAEQELYPRSHSKDAATWQEDLDERHFDYSGCMGAQLVVTCMTAQAKAERTRAAQRRREIASEKQKAQAPAAPSP